MNINITHCIPHANPARFGDGIMTVIEPVSIIISKDPLVRVPWPAGVAVVIGGVVFRSDGTYHNGAIIEPSDGLYDPGSPVGRLVREYLIQTAVARSLDLQGIGRVTGEPSDYGTPEGRAHVAAMHEVEANVAAMHEVEANVVAERDEAWDLLSDEEKVEVRRRLGW